MFAPRFVVGMLVLFLAPIASFAGAGCILSQVGSIDTLKPVETLIVAENLDLAYGANERRFVSNDGTVQLRITRTASKLSNSDLLASVYVNEKKVITTIGQSSGSALAVQTANTLPDGRVFVIMCHAAANPAPTPTPTN